ncbi:hypothetical protein O59_000421 [Cellvibrio sp. BR]|nr:hypothetical protein O59_000421 [Cellvibrio sp. BR]
MVLHFFQWKNSFTKAIKARSASLNWTEFIIALASGMYE